MEPINVFEYEKLAQPRMAPPAWDYYQGGSDDEVTLRANRAAFERLRLRPRVLVDVSAVDLRTTVLGTPVSMPILAAPTALHALAHPTEGECATARGVGAAGTLMTVSTSASRSVDEVARAATGPLWFQLYVGTTWESTGQLVRKAEAAGYRAIVLTADTPHLGRRERDIRNDWRKFLRASGVRFANFPDDEQEPSQDSEEEDLLPTWETLGWLRSISTLPIIVKGLLTAEDARLALEHGAAGIVVSNHGGRQLDTVQATIDALPEIVEAVAGGCEVYLDGGIRRGTDVLKALALGARAVLVGRPILWGLAVNGAEGVRHVLELLRAELELAMMLAGRPTIQSIDRAVVKAGDS